MSGSLTKTLAASLILAGLAVPALAQNTVDILSVPPLGREASFLESGIGNTSHGDGFSGLATAPPEALAPAVSASAPLPATSPTPSLVAEPVAAAPLPAVSAESIGVQNANNLSAAMWKGTPRVIAERLMSMAVLTESPVLNNLARRLFATAAVPPEGDGAPGPSLTSMRVKKLVLFGDGADAWALTQQADPKLIDDVTFHAVAQNRLLSDKSDLCPLSGDWARTRSGADWQKFFIVCQLRAKDTKAAQVALDVFRTQTNRDTVFLSIADKNILGGAKALPSQLTPLTPETLALLAQANLPLPGDLYSHADYATASALLRLSAQQDVAQLALAERAAQHGVISTAELGAIYRTVSFPPDLLAAPLLSLETGLRQRALLYQAALADNDPSRRVAYAVKFVQSASPAFLNGAGSIVAEMVGNATPDAALADNAVAVAQIYMLAGRNDTALAWLRIASRTPANIENSQNIWPQFVLAGLEGDSAYGSDLARWVDAALKPNQQTDMQALRDRIGAVLLLLDAAGFTVPDEQWGKVLASPRNEKRAGFDPVLFERVQAAGVAGRSAETILLSVALAGDGDISVPVAVAITRALRAAGFKTEAANFARQNVALLTAKAN